jgi:dienelactone hydrolase
MHRFLTIESIAVKQNNSTDIMPVIIMSFFVIRFARAACMIATGLLALCLLSPFIAAENNAGGSHEIWGKGEVLRITDPQQVPGTLEEIWDGYEKDYDANNPLEVKVHKTWEVDGGAIVVNWVQMTLGTFQGKKSIVCGYWAYPKGVHKLPGLVVFHGGPQTASENGAVNWARLGYAVFHPNHNDKAAMGGEAQGLPNTDWGALNAWGAKGPDGPFQADETTIDAVPSPRNDWQFARQISGRRIISFLQQQPQVDPTRIGVRGHSTGGSLTTLVSIDPRVTAAVPSVGGVGGFMDAHPVITGNTRHLRLDGERRALFDETLEMRTFWKKMHAPVLLLGASNDFNAPDWNCLEALKQAGVDKRYTTCANYNHAFPPETMVADYLWFQDKLKGQFSYPATPKAELVLDRGDGVPVFKVTPPQTKLKLKRVEMFYTDGRNPLTRFWITGDPTHNADGRWEIPCPVIYTDEPLTAFANLIYEIDPIQAPHHKYNGQSEMAVSSDSAYASPEDLQAAGVKASPSRKRMIDDFSAGLRDWGGNLSNGHWWQIDTRKVSDPRYLGPKGAELVVEINSPVAGQKVGVLLERNFMEANNREQVFYAFIDLPKQGWNTVRIKTGDLHNPFGWPLDDWHKISRLALMSAARLKNQIEGDYAQRAGEVTKRMAESDPKYKLKLGAVPDKVSGWSEDYYQDGGDEYTKFNMMTKDDVLARQRFRNLRWESGEYVERSKPYVKEVYQNPVANK